MDCLVSKEFRESLASQLHSEGVAQIEFLDDSLLEKQDISRDSPAQRVSLVSELIVRSKRILDSLEPYCVEGGGFLENLLGVSKTERLVVRELSFNELLEEAREVINPAEESLNELQSRLGEIEKKTAELNALVERYSPFRGLGLHSSDFEDSHYAHKAVGVIPTESLPALEQALSEKLSPLFVLQKLAVKDENSVVVLVAMKHDVDTLDDLLRRGRFTKLSVDLHGKFDDALSDAKTQLENLSQEKSAVEHSLTELSRKSGAGLLAVTELLEIETQRCEIFTSCGSTENTTYMRLWVPLKDSGRVEELIKTESKNHCAIQKSTNLDDAPVLLSNPWWLRPFEGLTHMFSPPKYNQMDPTLLIAPTFILFFGFMMSDFFYGLGFIAAALFLNAKYARYSPSIKDLCFILVCFGVSAMFFGVLTGNYLGDFVGKYVLGSSSQEISLWLDPLYDANAITVLVLALCVGVIQVYSGYFFGFLDKMRRGELKAAVTEQLSWFVIAAGVGMFALTLYPQGNPVLGQAYARLSALVFIAGFLLLMLSSGLMAFMDLSGLLGRIMSYSRLLALTLTTSGMAVAFNMLASLSLSIPYVGWVLAPLIFVGSHTAILMLNALGSFVHSIRLHYVEFFGTFYSGGGVEFRPFKEERRYTCRGE